MKTLEDILKEYFDCEKPFLKRKKLVGYYHDGTKCYEYLTKSGSVAYQKLTDLIYDLQSLGVLQDADNVIESLDEIIRE